MGPFAPIEGSEGGVGAGDRSSRLAEGLTGPVPGFEGAGTQHLSRQRCRCGEPAPARRQIFLTEGHLDILRRGGRQ